MNELIAASADAEAMLPPADEVTIEEIAAREEQYICICTTSFE